MTCPPQDLQYWRWLCSVLAKVPTFSSPLVIATFSGFHSVKALSGAADQDRQDPQWQ